MAGLYGDYVAKDVTQGSVRIFTTGWTALIAGSAIKPDRRHIRIFGKGPVGNAIALEYVNISADGTFTAPTGTTDSTTVFPGNTRWIEPLGDTVQLYGRMIPKAASTQNSLKVIVTEYE